VYRLTLSCRQWSSVGNIDSLKLEVEKERAVLDAIFDLETCLDQIDGGILFGEVRNSQTDGFRQYKKIKNAIQNEYDEFLNNEQFHHVTLSPVSICNLEEQ